MSELKEAVQWWFMAVLVGYGLSDDLAPVNSLLGVLLHTVGIAYQVKYILRLMKERAVMAKDPETFREALEQEGLDPDKGIPFVCECMMCGTKITGADVDKLDAEMKAHREVCRGKDERLH